MWLSCRQRLTGLLKSHPLQLSAPPAFRIESECRDYCLRSGIHTAVQAVFSPCQSKGPSTWELLINSGFGEAFRAEATRTQLEGGPIIIKREIPQCYTIPPGTK